MNSDDQEVLDYYARFWRRCLSDIAHWTPQQIAAWFATRGQVLLSDTLTLHENPAYWIVEELMPEQTKLKFTKRHFGSKIIGRVAYAMCDSPEWLTTDGLVDMDMQGVRTRFTAILATLESEVTTGPETPPER